MMFLTREILPILRRSAPAPFRVVIAGRRPDATVRRLAELDGVEVVPDPPTLAPYYARADVAIVPVRSGAGTRIKILEAFSFGVPVVSTEMGAEGLELTGGTDLLFGDTAEAFAAACLDLMRDPAVRDALWRAASRVRGAVWARRLRAVLRQVHPARTRPGRGPHRGCDRNGQPEGPQGCHDQRGTRHHHALHRAGGRSAKRELRLGAGCRAAAAADRPRGGRADRRAVRQIPGGALPPDADRLRAGARAGRGAEPDQAARIRAPAGPGGGSGSGGAAAALGRLPERAVRRRPASSARHRRTSAGVEPGQRAAPVWSAAIWPGICARRPAAAAAICAGLPARDVPALRLGVPRLGAHHGRRGRRRHGGRQRADGHVLPAPRGGRRIGRRFGLHARPGREQPVGRAGRGRSGLCRPGQLDHA